MESGLLRVLKQSSKSSGDTGGWRAIADEMEAGGKAQAAAVAVVEPAPVGGPAPVAVAAAGAIAVAPPAPVAVEESSPAIELPEPELIELAPEPDEPAPTLLPLVVEAPELPAPANDRKLERTTVVAVPSRRRSRVMMYAGLVAALVIAADVSMFVLHRHNVASRPATPAATPAAAPAPPAKLPAYMVLPEHPVWPQAAPPPPTPPAATINAPAAAPADDAAAPRSHHHHHHHSKH